MGNGMENLMERLEKELEEEKMARIKRRRWRRRFMLLMVFGVIMFSISAVTAAFTKSLVAGDLWYWVLYVCSHIRFINYITNVNYKVGNYRG